MKTKKRVDDMKITVYSQKCEEGKRWTYKIVLIRQDKTPEIIEPIQNWPTMEEAKQKVESMLRVPHHIEVVDNA